MKDEYLKMSEVAQILHVCPATVRKLIREGKIRAIEIGGEKRKSYRVLAAELDRFTAEEYERRNNEEINGKEFLC